MTAPVLPLPTERRRRSDSKLTDRQLRVLHRLHIERNVSIRGLGRLIWKQLGFASADAAGRAVTRGFARLHLPARDQVDSRPASMATGYRRCEEIRASGERCEAFCLPGSDRCWPHHPEFRDQARESAIRNSPWVAA